MNQARDVRNIVLGVVLTASGLSALAAINLTTFTPNTPIKSSEVNANFASLKDAVEAPIGASRLETTGTAADGKVLKLQAGGLAWADDLTGGTGGTAYSAGTGLALSGTTFSVANAGITRAMLSTSGTVADGKVLKLSGGNLTWAEDLAGAGGSTYSADGSSLALNGTTFSVKDGGIGTSKLSAGAVTPNKITLPLILSSNAPGATLQLSSSGAAALFATGTTSTPTIWGVGAAGGGVRGDSSGNTGVYGESGSGIGVNGSSISNAGVYGVSNSNRGVLGSSTSGTGVVGLSVTGSSGSFVGGGGGSGLCYFNGGAGWVCTSDRNKKENFKSVNAQAVLEKLAAMPVTRWNMKGDRNKTPHMGPVAQDFKAAFGLGESDKTINAADAQGVALAAIKGMYEKNQALEHQVETLEIRLKALEKSISLGAR
jgi:Chaperone of endosialidase